MRVLRRRLQRAYLTGYRRVLPELNVTFSLSFSFPGVLGQEEHEDEGDRQGDEAHP